MLAALPPPPAMPLTQGRLLLVSLVSCALPSLRPLLSFGRLRLRPLVAPPCLLFFPVSFASGNRMATQLSPRTNRRTAVLWFSSMEAPSPRQQISPHPSYSSPSPSPRPPACSLKGVIRNVAWRFVMFTIEQQAHVEILRNVLQANGSMVQHIHNSRGRPEALEAWSSP